MQIKNVRFIIALITTISAYAVYVSRVNLSIAIIAMVEDGHQHATNATETTPAIMGNQQTGANSTESQRPANNVSPPVPANVTSPMANLNKTLATPSNQTRTKASSPERFLGGTFPASKQTIMNSPLAISQFKFHWDQTEQGQILGAFFFGYILFQIPGARMAELVGARWILIAATAGSALVSLIFPLSTQLNSIHLLMALRFAMGLCQSAFFPAAYVFFCRWLTEAERSVLLPIMFIGSNMGSISTYIMSSYLISSSYGWPSVFYVSGMICLFVTVLWCIFGSNGPEDNWLITPEECDYIIANVKTMPVNKTHLRKRQRIESEPSCCSDTVKAQPNCGLSPPPSQPNQTNGPTKSINKSKSANDLMGHTTPGLDAKKIGANHLLMSELKEIDQVEAGQMGEPKLNWCKLLTSVPVWTLIFSMYGNEWSQVVLTYELPTYLNKAHDIPIEQNGVINSFFQLSYTVASPILSSFGAYILERRVMRMRKIHVRKLFQSLATFGQMACFVSVPICGANKGLIILFMFAAIVFKACANAGDIMVAGDLSPEFAGTIFALANSVGNTAGFFVPLLAGAIVNDQYVREQWTPFWLTSASIMACSGLIFLVLGETRRQNYAADSDQDDEALDRLDGSGLMMQRRPSLSKKPPTSINKLAVVGERQLLQSS